MRRHCQEVSDAQLRRYFFVIAIIAAVLGFSGIAGAASNIAWNLFVVFLILAAVSMLRAAASSAPTPARTCGPAIVR